MNLLICEDVPISLKQYYDEKWTSKAAMKRRKSFKDTNIVIISINV